VSRRQGPGTGAILRELRAQGDRIVAAIHEASAEQRAHREAQVDRARTFLRDALDEGTPRTVVLDPPPRAPANDTGEPPESGPRS